MKNRKKDNVLDEAKKCVFSTRNSKYGDPLYNFRHIAHIASSILSKPITPEEVVLIMIATKLSREMHSADKDNYIDLAGYAQILYEVKNENRY